MTTTSTTSAISRRRTELTNGPVAWLERMIEIRLVEDAVGQLYSQGLVRGSIHTCQGQEAVAVAVAAVTTTSDYLSTTYRGHGVALAAGVLPEQVIGEVLGRSIGCAQGLGGSMHMTSSTAGLLPTSAIVGAGLPVAVGAALSSVMLGTEAVSLCLFGDGASNIGAFHESLNLAAVWALPVVFVCENNLYAEYSPIRTTTPIEDIAVRGTSYGMRAAIVDGQDIDAVVRVMSESVAHARSGAGPVLIEAKTYRYSGHSRSDAATYRSAEELERWRARDPIDLLAQRLIAEGLLTADEVTTLHVQISERVSAATTLSKQSPEPDLRALFQNINARTH